MKKETLLSSDQLLRPIANYIGLMEQPTTDPRDLTTTINGFFDIFRGKGLSSKDVFEQLRKMKNIPYNSLLPHFWHFIPILANQKIPAFTELRVIFYNVYDNYLLKHLKTISLNIIVTSPGTKNHCDWKILKLFHQLSKEKHPFVLQLAFTSAKRGPNDNITRFSEAFEPLQTANRIKVLFSSDSQFALICPKPPQIHTTSKDVECEEMDEADNLDDVQAA